MPVIKPSLWFDGNFDEAVAFYTSVFPDSGIEDVFRQGGVTVAGDFRIAGFTVNGINGPEPMPFTEAFSLVVECDSQEEVDHYWEVLTADGGQESQCGWLKDKFGLSWQIVPVEFLRMLQDPDQDAVKRATDVMLTQRKLELEPLRAAFAG